MRMGWGRERRGNGFTLNDTVAMGIITTATVRRGAADGGSLWFGRSEDINHGLEGLQLTRPNQIKLL